MSIVDDLKAALIPSSENGAMLAVGLLGAATLLAAASKGGTFTGKVSAGPFAGSFAYQGSRASRWNDYVGSRVPELMAQGMSAPEAMKQAASEYRERG